MIKWKHSVALVKILLIRQFDIEALLDYGHQAM